MALAYGHAESGTLTVTVLFQRGDFTKNAGWIMGKAKKQAFKLPKKIAGIKIPKAIRNSSGSIVQFLETPQGREIAASALAAMAAAITSNKKARHAVADAGRGTANTGSSLTRGIAEAATGVATGVLVEAARHILPSRDDGQGADTAGRDGGEARQTMAPAQVAAPRNVRPAPDGDKARKH